MYRDEIIAEVWRNRDAYVRQHHHNLDEIVEDLRRRQQTPLTRVVDRRGKCAGANLAPPKGDKA
jgi:DNA-binding winged helix-turn-helix (wHTH) protein